VKNWRGKDEIQGTVSVSFRDLGDTWDALIGSGQEFRVECAAADRLNI
jgi:hypothetical protein